MAITLPIRNALSPLFLWGLSRRLNRVSSSVHYALVCQEGDGTGLCVTGTNKYSGLRDFKQESIAPREAREALKVAGDVGTEVLQSCASSLRLRAVLGISSQLQVCFTERWLLMSSPFTAVRGILRAARPLAISLDLPSGCLDHSLFGHIKGNDNFPEDIISNKCKENEKRKAHREAHHVCSKKTISCASENGLGKVSRVHWLNTFKTTWSKNGGI